MRRRILMNYRALPDVVQRLLPPPFRPKLHADSAIVGICLIRLEQVRPRGIPAFLGTSSENAAHRIAVTWEERGKQREGVYITRRHTDSRLNRLAGGRLFPGEYHPATFHVQDDGLRVDLDMNSRAGGRDVVVQVRGTAAEEMPHFSEFSSVEEASAFFEPGASGWSAAKPGGRLEGIRLRTRAWEIAPLKTEHVFSSFFNDKSRFPQDTIVFDCALIMRRIRVEWHGEADLRI